MLALMPRSIAARRERRRFHSPGALRCVSKHEAHAVAVLILRDARTLFRLCGSACACALLRMRTAIAFQPISRCQTAHLVPAARLLRPGFATLLHSPRTEGWAERRSAARTSSCRLRLPQVTFQA